MLNLALKYMLGRLTEPSTYAGVAGVLAGLHLAVSPDMASNIAGVAMSLAGMLGVFLKEKNIL